MSDPVLGTTGAQGAGELDPVLPDSADGDFADDDVEVVAAESADIETNDAVAGETVDPGLGEGQYGPTGGAPTEIQPELHDNELAGEDSDLRDHAEPDTDSI